MLLFPGNISVFAAVFRKSFQSAVVFQKCVRSMLIFHISRNYFQYVCAATSKIFFQYGFFSEIHVLLSPRYTSDQCVVISGKFSSLCCCSQHILFMFSGTIPISVVDSGKDINVCFCYQLTICAIVSRRSSNSYLGWFQNRARIFKLLSSPRIDSKEPIPPQPGRPLRKLYSYWVPGPPQIV